MPNHQTPLNVLDLTGRLQHDKKRFKDRAPAPQTHELNAAPPTALTLDFETAWAMILEAAPQGVLRQSDAFLVEEAARLLMIQRNSLVMARWEGNPLPPFSNSVHKAFVAVLAKLGMTPSDIGHVSAPAAPKADNDFDD